MGGSDRTAGEEELYAVYKPTGSAKSILLYCAMTGHRLHDAVGSSSDSALKERQLPCLSLVHMLHDQLFFFIL